MSCSCTLSKILGAFLRRKNVKFSFVRQTLVQAGRVVESHALLSALLSPRSRPAILNHPTVYEVSIRVIFLERLAARLRFFSEISSNFTLVRTLQL